MRVSLFVLVPIVFGHIGINAQQEPVDDSSRKEDRIHRSSSDCPRENDCAKTKQEKELGESQCVAYVPKVEMVHVDKLLNRIHEKDDLLSSLINDKIELAEKLNKMNALNDQLQSEIKGMRDHQANAASELPESADEKNKPLPNMAPEEKDPAKKLAKSAGTNARVESDVQVLSADLLQASPAAAVAESTITSLHSDVKELQRENKSLHEQLNQIRESNSHDLLEAAAAAAESTITSLRSDVKELQRENKSLHEQLNQIRESNSHNLLEAAAAEAESTITSLRSGAEESRRENESLHEQQNEILDKNSHDLLEAAAASAESTINSLRTDVKELRRENESPHDQLNVIRDSNSHKLLQAAAAAAESTINSLRSDVKEFRRENESSHEQQNQIRDSNSHDLLQAAIAVTEPSIISIRSDPEEVYHENGSSHEQQDEIQDKNSHDQQLNDVSPLPPPIIGFDDVSNTTRKSVPIPNGYHGLNWEDVNVMRRSRNSGSRYEHGAVSGDYMAVVMHVGSITSTTPFSVAGLQATSASGTGLNVLFESFDSNGNRIGEYTTTLGHPSDGPTSIDLRGEGNFEGMYKLTITASGGASAAGMAFHSIVAMDNLNIY